MLQSAPKYSKWRLNTQKTAKSNNCKLEKRYDISNLPVAMTFLICLYKKERLIDKKAHSMLAIQIRRQAGD
jgi:hypothetical protein